MRLVVHKCAFHAYQLVSVFLFYGLSTCACVDTDAGFCVAPKVAGREYRGKSKAVRKKYNWSPDS